MQERSAWQYFTDCCIQNYANFEGRARREEYWYFRLFSILILIAIIGLIGFLVIATKIEELALVGMYIAIFFYVALILPNLAVTARRLHDTGKSGWLYLIAFIPLGGIILLVFMCTEGDRGPNQYGQDPKAVDIFDEI